ncbi:progesterone binding protein [Dacryopinax primogenitus]|uniref:Progesterone binding protein n=1 Tax=Dacryopinax primogenitus (strain DJM 731) TaxID=1858805 RepID=M5G9F7_DACPD|nr:progesterone binding protein [Dacryopinax primogenitus]EJU02497.1 progesterone binding protein [Dacryopinax primogenitus]
MAAPNPSFMSAPPASLPPPGNKQLRLADLKSFDGTQPGKPIYVSIKGTVFDVTSRAESYGPAGAYHIFAGKDASKGLGSSSLKPEDAVYDWSGLNDKDKKVLGDWFSFFQKRYPIVGYVADIPANLRV